MFEKLSILKGLHPGFFLEHELKKKKLSKRQFALSLSEHPQTIGAITKGNRDMNTALSLRIEEALGLEEGFLMMLQVFYDIKKNKEKQKSKPDLSVFSTTLFWDTKIENIDWSLHKKFIVSRVLEYGNEKEKQEILSFYGKDAIEKLTPKTFYKRPTSLNGINII
ncbi:helix-turn-helix transcriptional regulator [Pedobacter roseus]|uniref:Plasmid maintenance system antidote protein n=1 Tax=Pedobacter roseus TaxID=336820 RepID=A0A7G9QHN5_9SPHI|nr:plasmid maintenance system antidote protein [Pedobacter roseus]QNN42860.1 plasmid maintenance system antidote protein [Pedobacter roseus]